MGSSIAVLTFHAIEDAPSPMSFPPRLFAEGLSALHADGFRAASLAEVIDALKLRRPLPDRAFAITFDDGYRSVYDAALPVLKELAMPATVFLSLGADADAAANDRLPPQHEREKLSWAEIAEMRRSGIDFGAHTISHGDLTRMPADQAEHEIVGSKAALEAKLGEPVRWFAYPGGRYDAQSRAIVAEHFDAAFSDWLGLSGAADDLYALPRVDSYYLRTPWLFLLLRSDWLDWYLRARNVPRRLRRLVWRHG